MRISDWSSDVVLFRSNMANPSRPERLLIAKPRNGHWISGDQGHTQIRAKEFRNRSDDRPGSPFTLTRREREACCAGYVSCMIVLPEQYCRIARKEAG